MSFTISIKKKFLPIQELENLRTDNRSQSCLLKGTALRFSLYAADHLKIAADQLMPF
ncbi:MAG: hypothetical protein J5934_02160 [Succinivibrio sp.]|nr:hypothetical protein [Succinivibrio sp.]